MKRGKGGIKYLIGIDEVGRGPVAGPVTVAVVMLPIGQNKKWLSKIKNSKALSPEKRLWWRTEAFRRGVPSTTSSVSASMIDQIGIAGAVRLAIKRALERLALKPALCRVLLDGSIKAPPSYLNQQTIVRGDESVPIIALASIVAKVHRDHKMTRLDKLFPGYYLAEHKGYGTKKHYRAIKKLGLSPLHRRSFLHALPKGG